MFKWLSISELFHFEKGSLQSSKAIPGKFPFITAAETWKTHETFTHDCEALIFAMGASGSLGRTHYINGKFISSDLCFILTPKKGKTLDMPFYYRLFNFLREDIVKKTSTGTSKLAINRSNFGNYKIPYFDYQHQIKFRDKIAFISDVKINLLNSFIDQANIITQLKQSILQEAISGRLTAEWRSHHPIKKGDPNFDAKALLAKIKAEKEVLMAEGKLKKEKPLSEILPDDIPFDLPKSWVWCHLVEIAEGFEYGSSSKSLKTGKVPVLRMGNLQNGLINLKDLVYTNDEKEIEQYLLNYGDLLFNRTNSRELVGKTSLFLDNKKMIYAGYLVRYRMIGAISFQYANYVMNSKLHREWCNLVKSDALGQSNINATKLRSFCFPLPPLAEQKIIVEKVDHIMKIIDQLEEQIKHRQKLAEDLMQTVLQEAFE